MIFSSDDSLLVLTLIDKIVRLWNSTTNQKMQKFEKHIKIITAVIFSSNDLLLVSTSKNEIVRLWNSTTNQKMQKFKKYINFIIAIIFSSNDSLLASTLIDKIVRLWNSTTNQKMQKFEEMKYNTTFNFTNDNEIIFIDHEIIDIKNEHFLFQFLSSSSIKL